MAHESAHPLHTGSRESGRHLVLSLVIAAVIVFGARWLTDQLLRPVPTPAPKAASAAPPAAVSADNSVEDELANQARKERQAREQAIVEQERVRREQKKADVMRARDEAIAASQAEEALKEAAWQRFFKPAKKCDAATDDATRVDCSNQYIRAKERFEKLYAEGKLH